MRNFFAAGLEELIAAVARIGNGALLFISIAFCYILIAVAVMVPNVCVKVFGPKQRRCAMHSERHLGLEDGCAGPYISTRSEDRIDSVDEKRSDTYSEHCCRCEFGLT